VILKLDETDWILLFTFHRIVCDTVSEGILVRGLEAEYARALGESPSGPITTAPAHICHAIRQRQVVGSPRLEQRVAARVEALSSAPTLSTLRADLTHPAFLRKLGNRARQTFKGDLGTRLTETARRFNLPTEVVALAVFALLVHRQTGQRDVVIGMPVDSRGPEFDGVVGQFADIMPIRSLYSLQQSFSDYLGTIAVTYQAAVGDREVAFGYLLQRLHLGGKAGHRQLVQLEFEYRQNAENQGQLGLFGVDVQVMQVDDGYANAEFSLLVEPSTDGSLCCTAGYVAELFSPDSANRILTHYGCLLERVLTDPGQAISSYPLASDAEMARLSEWNDTAMEFPEAACLHELIEEQVRSTPAATAVVYGERHITYAELDRQANQLAHLLVGQGVRVDDVVAICMDRSLELVIALLAILKAGAGYLPLDTDMPRARLDRMVSNAQATTCLTMSHLRDHCPETIAQICLDGPGPATGRSTAKPQVAVAPENLVSVYYTSGSTGEPKGVASTHRGWVNRMVWMQRRHQLRVGETVLHKTTLAFDDSALELFWPLSVGGRIALLAPELHRDPEAILKAAVTYRAVHLQTVPSMLALLLDAIRSGDRAGLSSLRGTVSSGEALSSSLVRRFYELMPGRLYNSWGATEVSIDSTYHLCAVDDAVGADKVSVGEPFDNNQVYVLDPLLREMPIDIVGDLYIGGVGLARGYLGDPVKTALAFVASPFRPGERMYRTGDRGYRCADGSIIFVGRQDHQVKIRGMRVELGEIESVLRGHAHVGDAVVTVHEAEGVPLRLAAYVAQRGDEWPSEVSLREHLVRLLPSYMWPATLHVLQRLPLNSNGKVDRQQLPAPSFDEDREDTGQLPLRGHLEPTIAAIWRDVLQRGSVGADSNFFDVGGQSLSAAQVVGRIRRRFAIELPVRALFDIPVLSAFSAEVERRVLERVNTMSEQEIRRFLRQIGR
jgi:amino acid adenylation domain-containing protein